MKINSQGWSLIFSIGAKSSTSLGKSLNVSFKNSYTASSISSQEGKIFSQGNRDRD